MNFRRLVKAAVAACIASALVGVTPGRAADSGDQIGDALTSAKAAGKVQMDKAEAALDLAIKHVATTETVEAMKIAIAEKDAFLRSDTLPKSPAMKAAVEEYRRIREASDKNLIDAYAQAVAEYAKHRNYSMASKVLIEMQEFTNRIDRISGVEGVGITTTREAMQDLDRRLVKYIAAARAEKTTESGAAAFAKTIATLDEELKSRTLVFRFKITAIFDDPAQGADIYRIVLAPPDEFKGLRDGWKFNSEWYAHITPNMGPVAEGDTLVLQGTGRMLQLSQELFQGTKMSDTTGQSPIAHRSSITPDVAFGVALDHATFRIEHKK